MGVLWVLKVLWVLQAIVIQVSVSHRRHIIWSRVILRVKTMLMRKIHSTKEEEHGCFIKSSDSKLFAFLIYVIRISVFRLTDYENALWIFDSICLRNFMIFTIFFIIKALLLTKMVLLNFSAHL